MKILMVAIPNRHFFQWVDLLRDCGHEIVWFDIRDGGPLVDSINWVKQIKGWKLKWDYPFRQKLKAVFPAFNSVIGRINTKNTNEVFEQCVMKFNPDFIHCFDMELTGIPLVEFLEKTEIPLIYSSWGSDIFYFKERGVDSRKVNRFLERVNFLITDCHRDAALAKRLAFVGDFLGVFPGNGGLELPTEKIKSAGERNIVLIKGYHYDVGRAMEIIYGIEKLDISTFLNLKILVYSAEDVVKEYIEKSAFFSQVDVSVVPRLQTIPNSELLEIMGKSILHIGNNLSDGMPNALLEAMGMGAFPIQSNPGNATEEVISHGKNGFLIQNPLNVNEISMLIKLAITDSELREKAQRYNVEFIAKKYSRDKIKPLVVALYEKLNINLTKSNGI